MDGYGVRGSMTQFRAPGPRRIPSRELTHITLVEGRPASDALLLREGAVTFVAPGWYEILLVVEWDPENRQGARFAHSRIGGSEPPLHSEAIPAGVLADISGGRQLLRGNGLFGPGGPDAIRLEVWQDSGDPVVVRAASLTVRELFVPWPPGIKAA